MAVHAHTFHITQGSTAKVAGAGVARATPDGGLVYIDQMEGSSRGSGAGSWPDRYAVGAPSSKVRALTHAVGPIAGDVAKLAAGGLAASYIWHLLQ